MRLVAEGKTDKEVAVDVFLSEHDRQGNVSSIPARLNLERRAQAAAMAGMEDSRGGI